MKFLLSSRERLLLRSRPARGAWVEMRLSQKRLMQSGVAPRKGRVG